MRIVVTGATGFIGGALARALAKAGHEVVGLARSSSNRHLLADLDITWREGDVTDPASLRAQFDGVVWLIHAAGMLGRAGVPEKTYFRLHEGGTAAVLAEAERAGVKRILHVSSPGVLGPIKGPAADETMPLLPSNAYERSKAAAEQVAQHYAQKGLPVVIARPEFVYGPGDMHVLGLFQAVKKGKFFYIDGGRRTCHPTFVADMVDGVCRILEQGRLGQIYHIAGPEPVSFRQLAETIADALSVSPPRLNVPRTVAWLGAAGLEMVGKPFNLQVPLSRDGVAFFSEDRRFSWQKAHDQLGYQPRYDLEIGVQKTISWYRQRGLL